MKEIPLVVSVIFAGIAAFFIINLSSQEKEKEIAFAYENIEYKSINPKQPKSEKNNLYIPVNEVLQEPELPNGCEITSLTSVLNYYGHKISKTVMANNYLPKKPLKYEDGKRYGPDPHEFYVGDPRLQPGGWYSYAEPIVKAGNTFLNEAGDSKRAINITGSSQKEILSYIEDGIPVIVWVTKDLSKPNTNSHWHLRNTGEYYPALTNLHVVVLNGKEEDKVHVMNPLEGQITYDLETFFNSYYEMGKHAIVVK